MNALWRTFSFLAILVSVTGCASTSAVMPPRLEVTHADYDAVFDAVVDTLRAQQFTLDRIDRRLGVVTTVPRTSASCLEPWKGDNATVALAVESTIHYQRRLVRVEFRAFGGGNPSAPSQQPANAIGLNQVKADSPPIFEAVRYPGTLVMTIDCRIERAQRPGMQIQPIALRESNITTDPLLGERGIPSRYWEPIERDPLMETRLARLITARADGAVRAVANEIQN